MQVLSMPTAINGMVIIMRVMADAKATSGRSWLTTCRVSSLTPAHGDEVGPKTEILLMIIITLIVSLLFDG